MKNITKGLVIYFICCMLVGAYMMVIHWIGSAIWPDQTKGSLIHSPAGEIRGSFLLGQEFATPLYFQGRPKEIVKNQCNLQFYLFPYKEAIEKRIIASSGASFENKTYAELIVPSASGLDPYISLGAAISQAPDIARYREISEAELEKLVHAHTTKARWPFFDMDIVNVVKLNEAILSPNF